MIYEQQSYKIRVKSPFLWMFTACFIVWQLGVLFYAGTTMSLFGRTPIPLVEEDTTAIIGIGYLASIVFLCIFPRKAVYIQRMVLPVALCATTLMLFPFSPATMTVLFYIETFVCVFSIGTMASLASHLFTVDTTWRDAVIGLSIGGVFIAVLQNDFIPVSFTVFTIFSLGMITALTLFHFLIPAKIQVPYASRKNKVQMPKILFWGTWLLNAFSTLLLCLASSFAESFTHGVSVFYISGAALAFLAGYLKKWYNKYSIKMFSTYFALTVVGFTLAALSIQVPALQVVACMLLGCIVTLANFWIFFCAVAFKFYPTRFIGAMGAGQGLILALIHTGLLQVFRDNTALLYGTYAVIATLMMLCYHFLEPYFTYEWQQSKKATIITSTAITSTVENTEKVNPFCALSGQERILADFILRGYTESIIASEMNITLNTQKSYRKNLYAKLDIHTKRELFELANKK